MTTLGGYTYLNKPIIRISLTRTHDVHLFRTMVRLVVPRRSGVSQLSPQKFDKIVSITSLI